MRTKLGSVVGTGNTYTYSVKDPRSDRERYIRAAPIDLHSPSQNHFILWEERQRGQTEWRLRAHSKTTTVRAMLRQIFISFLLAQETSGEKVKINPRAKESRVMCLLHSKHLSTRRERYQRLPTHGECEQKTPFKFKIKKTYERVSRMSSNDGNETDHKRYLCNHSQRYPYYTLVGSQRSTHAR